MFEENNEYSFDLKVFDLASAIFNNTAKCILKDFTIHVRL